MGDTQAFVKALTDAGIAPADAKELGKIVAAEGGEISKSPSGRRRARGSRTTSIKPSMERGK